MMSAPAQVKSTGAESGDSAQVLETCANLLINGMGGLANFFRDSGQEIIMPDTGAMKPVGGTYPLKLIICIILYNKSEIGV